MWYLNPKNIGLIALSVLLLGLSIVYLFQRTAVTELEGQNRQLVTDNLIQVATISGLNQNIKAIEKHQARVQIVENNTQTVREIVRLVKPDIPLGGNCNDITPAEKQKIQDAVGAAVTLFNTGVYSKIGDSAAAKEVLPPPSGTEAHYADGAAAQDGG